MHPYILSVFLLFFCLSACNSRTAEIAIHKNDTTEVIEFAIRKAFYHHNLPADDQLTKKYYFKDSILFTADFLPLKYLPTSVDSANFKILPQEQIVQLIGLDSKVMPIPIFYALVISKSLILITI